MVTNTSTWNAVYTLPAIKDKTFEWTSGCACHSFSLLSFLSPWIHSGPCGRPTFGIMRCHKLPNCCSLSLCCWMCGPFVLFHWLSFFLRHLVSMANNSTVRSWISSLLASHDHSGVEEAARLQTQADKSQGVLRINPRGQECKAGTGWSWRTKQNVHPMNY